MRGQLESEIRLARRRGEMYQSCAGDRYPESGDIFSGAYVNRVNQISAARRM